MPDSHTRLDDFWSNVVRSSTDRVFSVTSEFYFCGQTEICQFQLHFLVQEKVSQFDAKLLGCVTLGG